jgi:hypothetical protein
VSKRLKSLNALTHARNNPAADMVPTRHLTTAHHAWTRPSTEPVQNFGQCSTFAYAPPSLSMPAA